MITYLLFKKVGLPHGRVGAGAASKFYQEPEPHKNDAALQHCNKRYTFHLVHCYIGP
jgi:hypothetical protein